jgi:hypothetical protein
MVRWSQVLTISRLSRWGINYYIDTANHAKQALRVQIRPKSYLPWLSLLQHLLIIDRAGHRSNVLSVSNILSKLAPTNASGRDGAAYSLPRVQGRHTLRGASPL